MQQPLSDNFYVHRTLTSETSRSVKVSNLQHRNFVHRFSNKGFQTKKACSIRLEAQIMILGMSKENPKNFILSNHLILLLKGYIYFDSSCTKEGGGGGGVGMTSSGIFRLNSVLNEQN